MNKFKIPALIAAAVLVISAAALFIFIKKDAIPPEGDKVNAPAWIHEEGSSGKLPISDSVDLSPKVSEKKMQGKQLRQIRLPQLIRSSRSNKLPQHQKLKLRLQRQLKNYVIK